MTKDWKNLHNDGRGKQHVRRNYKCVYIFCRKILVITPLENGFTRKSMQSRRIYLSG
jgi:hypothetical protein